MKKLVLVVAVVLSGCAVIFPKPHDPVMFDQIVAIDIQVRSINCSNREWGNLLGQVHHLKVYTELRGDPQAKAVGQLQDALLKAQNSQEHDMNMKDKEQAMQLQQMMQQQAKPEETPTTEE